VRSSTLVGQRVARAAAVDLDAGLQWVARTSSHAQDGGEGVRERRAGGAARVVEINGWSWSERPSVDEAEQAVLGIAAGEWDEDRTAEWLGAHLVDGPAP
jgi:hypothetical protein